MYGRRGGRTGAGGRPIQSRRPAPRSGGWSAGTPPADEASAAPGRRLAWGAAGRRWRGSGKRERRLIMAPLVPPRQPRPWAGGRWPLSQSPTRSRATPGRSPGLHSLWECRVQCETFDSTQRQGDDLAMLADGRCVSMRSVGGRFVGAVDAVVVRQVGEEIALVALTLRLPSCKFASSARLRAGESALLLGRREFRQCRSQLKRLPYFKSFATSNASNLRYTASTLSRQKPRFRAHGRSKSRSSQGLGQTQFFTAPSWRSRQQQPLQ